MPKLFVSYSRVDTALTEVVVARLRRVYGLPNVWYDDELHGGSRWWKAILEQIAACDVFIYLLSNESVTSPYCHAEFTEAQRLGKPIVTVQIRDKTRLSDDLNEIQYVDMKRGLNDENLARLIRAINEQALLPKARRALWTPITPLPTLPNDEDANRTTRAEVETPTLQLSRPPTAPAQGDRIVARATITAALITGVLAILAVVVGVILPPLWNPAPTPTLAAQNSTPLTPTPQSTALPPINLVIDPAPMNGGMFVFDIVLTSGNGVREYRIRLFRESGEPVLSALSEQFVLISDGATSTPNTTRVELPINELPCGPLVVRVRPMGESRVFLTDEEYISDDMVVVCTPTPTRFIPTFIPTFTSTFIPTVTMSPIPLVITVGAFRPVQDMLSFEVRRDGVGEVRQYSVSATILDINEQIFTPVPWEVESNPDLPTIVQILISPLPQTDIEFCVQAIGANGRPITVGCNIYNPSYTPTPTHTPSSSPTASNTPLPSPTPTQPLSIAAESLQRRDDRTYAFEIVTTGDDPVVNYRVQFMTENGETLYETVVRVTGTRTLVLFPTDGFTESFVIVMSALDVNDIPLPGVPTVTREAQLMITTTLPEQINLGSTIGYNAGTRQFAIPTNPQGDEPVRSYTITFAVNGAVRSRLEKLEPPTNPILFTEEELTAYLTPGEYDVFVRFNYQSGQAIEEQISYEHDSRPPEPTPTTLSDTLRNFLPVLLLFSLILLIFITIVWWRGRERPDDEEK